jgi:uncharacterized protein YjiS (DUF1127 family)
LIRSFSFGGGVQSTAALVLQAQGELDYPLFLFANVGDDSENPASIAYVREVAMPYAAEHGIELVELQRTMRDGTPETLLGRMRRRPKSLPIPVRLSSGAPASRTCTMDFKVRVIAKELKRRGASDKNPAITALGISLDEIHRAKSNSGFSWQSLVYPLLDLGLRRSDCLSIIAKAGLPIPEPSSCYFCPFHSMEAWRRQARSRPDLFAKAVALEEELTANQKALGKPPVWLTDALRPLSQVAADDGQMEFDLEGGCSTGHCFT